MLFSVPSGGRDMTLRRLPIRRRKQTGQAMIEFVILVPAMFMLVFGFVDLSIMMFDVGATRFAASEAARAEAVVGSLQGQTCDAPCVAVFGGAKTTCDADCRAIVTINATAVGSTSLEHVQEIDIQQYKDDGTGNIVEVPCGATVCQNRYNLDGTCIASSFCTDVACPSTNGSWPTACRSVTLGSQDYLNIFIKYEYQWKTGLYSSIPFPQLNAGYIVRLEPQKFA